MKIAIAVLVIATVVFAIDSLRWKISALAMIYYIEKNQYKQPNNEEAKECTGFVIENMLRDLAKGRR